MCLRCNMPLSFKGLEEEDGEPYELYMCPCGETQTLNTFVTDTGDPFPYIDD